MPALGLALLLLAGGAAAAGDPPAPPAEGHSARPKIGLALSGGGARGFAHVGALQALEELRVPVDLDLKLVKWEGPRAHGG